ncbi:N-acetylmuramoyl-L-alanine amidase [Deinococcus sp. AJ005]|uniref:N-acetylmuramoyl-L-alanine amidase n=1 Tax=Deinococcus sp. AJ005 TaxID=2652443 RepID=UPI00125CB820|nr:N-acetylmuramoyl-L-alanine amidase [Deinococcus sp. AJ005]QFP78042.1 N-acetylmuramoyl-L-alanine amidase [Deinococcus sp. AJ005]
MKQKIILFSSALLLGVAGTGLAQANPAQSNLAQSSDPFIREVPAQAAPVLRGTPVAAPAPINLTGVQDAAFGSPRSSQNGSITRVVFDLPTGVSYTLTPTFTGLRLDIQGARVIPTVSGKLGDSVNEYRAGGGQATLITPYPLSLTGGWQATETTIGTGGRVLILDFAASLTGGASAELGKQVRTVAQGSAPSAAIPAAPPLAPVATSPKLTPPVALSVPRAVPAQVIPTQANPVQATPPGDDVTPAPGGPLPPAPALPGANPETPSALSGQVPGTARGAMLSPPRIGKNPGQTRVVLDLPPGTTYRIVPGGIGLRVELSGVSVVPQVAQNISPELRSWRAESTLSGAVFTLLTAAPTTARSGWRAQLLPPASGDLSRLAIDLSPALADLTPLLPEQKLLAAVPAIPAARGMAILALSASYTRPRVVIDPGHGGRDPGAVGAVIEKEVVLDVALRVAALLRAAGVDVVLTRDRDGALNPDKNTDLTMRAKLGTPGTQLFVSIHVNAMDARSALRGYGVETWWNPNHPLSSSLAALLQTNVVSETGAFSQGLKNSQSLAVLRNSRIPAALIEIGYTSHPVDGLNLQDTNYRDRVALGIAQGIREALVSGIVDGGAVGGAGK